MERLRHQSLGQSRPPAYPTKPAALADPALLKEHLPPAWLGRRELAGAAALFLAGGTLSLGTGCTFGAPVVQNVCLTEKEALHVIRDELNHQGLILGEENVVLPEIQFTNSYGETAPLSADLADTQRDIAVEYLDERAYWQCHPLVAEGAAAPADVADALVAAAADQAPTLRLGVFTTERDASGDCDAAVAEESLREQVRDFVDWLKAQGVI